MTFSNMGGVGSECGPSNGLTRLMKQVGQDQSLQQVFQFEYCNGERERKILITYKGSLLKYSTRRKLKGSKS
jgi:hypothetical protein